MMHLNKKGFTLVELSIVLVIIGLLIGGILVAQSLIDSTKIQSFTRQISQFDAAVGLFEDKYRSLPGDTDLFPDGGNNDGYIETTDSFQADEMGSFWYHLSLNGLKNENGENYSNDASASGISSDNAPKASIGNNNHILVSGEESLPALDVTGISNAYAVTDCSAMTNEALNCSDGVTDIEALSIDTKIDDGDGTTGNIVGITASSVAENIEFISGTEIAHTTTGDINRTLVIRIGATSGVLK